MLFLVTFSGAVSLWKAPALFLLVCLCVLVLLYLAAESGRTALSSKNLTKKNQARLDQYMKELPTAVQRQLIDWNPEEPIVLKSLEVFAAGILLGFRRVSYSAECRPSDGAFFWITKEHAKSIGEILAGANLEDFRLSLTCFEEGALPALIAALGEKTSIRTLVVSHRSGDEVTAEEAEGLALLAVRVGAQDLKLWAGEFDPGALDRMAATLAINSHHTVSAIEVFDVSGPEGIPVKNAALETYLAGAKRD